jgi:hypothetical protein
MQELVSRNIDGTIVPQKLILITQFADLDRLTFIQVRSVRKKTSPITIFSQWR